MNNIQDVLSKQMDRKEFLQHIGVGSLFLLGGGMFYQALMNASRQNKKTGSKGYGSSAYGGRKA